MTLPEHDPAIVPADAIGVRAEIFADDAEPLSYDRSILSDSMIQLGPIQTGVVASECARTFKLARTLLDSTEPIDREAYDHAERIRSRLVAAAEGATDVANKTTVVLRDADLLALTPAERSIAELWLALAEFAERVDAISAGVLLIVRERYLAQHRPPPQPPAAKPEPSVSLDTTCSHCHRPRTVVIAGASYCKRHARELGVGPRGKIV